MTNDASKDQNDVSTLLGVSNSDGSTPVKIWASPSTHRLLVDSSGGGGTPGAPDTSVQFNDSGSFGGDANFTFDKTTGTVEINNTITGNGFIVVYADKTATNGANLDFTNGDDSTINAASAQTASADGFNLLLNAGAGGVTSGSGGSLSLNAGNATGGSSSGGALAFTAGNATGGGDAGFISMNAGSGGTGAGGFFVMNGGTGGTNSDGGGFGMSGGAGNGSGDGGAIELTSGQGGSTGDGGTVSLHAEDGGSSSGAGGAVFITAGDGRGGDSNGGTVNISSGEGHGAGSSGDVNITANGNADINLTPGGDGFSGAINVLLTDLSYDQANESAFNINAVSSNPPHLATFKSLRKILTYSGATQSFTIYEIPSDTNNYSVIVEVRATAVSEGSGSEGTSHGASFGRRGTFSSVDSDSPEQLGVTQNFYTENNNNLGDITLGISTNEVQVTITPTAQSTQWVCELFWIISSVPQGA